MKIKFNGQLRDIKARTLAELVEVYHLNPETLVIEQNGVVAKRVAWPTTPVNAEDQIEIVAFVGGG
jgi:thiamine biosynthesis protein ThiS